MHLPTYVSSLQLFITFMIGIVIGFSFAKLLRTTDCNDFVSYGFVGMVNGNENDSIDVNSQSSLNNVIDLELPITIRNPTIVNGNQYKLPNTKNSNNKDIYHNETNSKDYNQKTDHLDEIVTSDHSIAKQLYKNVRILCWILTSPANHVKRAIHVKRTWGKRCNKLLFMSSESDDELGTVKLAVNEGRSNLWHKTREAAKYIYEKHFHEADWFLKADDDTYVIMENLRAFLYSYSSDEPVYFGCKFKPHVRQGYMSGGAGYVLSRESLKRFAEEAYPNATICRQSPGGSEDKEIGLCLQNVNVVAGDSRDELKRGRFFPSTPSGHIIPKDRNHWYWRYIFYNTKDGKNCCSDYAISFHYIQPNYMYVMDYLIYQLNPYGIQRRIASLPRKRDTKKWLQIWRNESSDNLLN